MIIEEKILININSNNIRYYKNIKYKNIYVGDSLEISTLELMKGSHLKIKCQCDICKKINIISNKDYNKNIKKYGYYTCVGKCSTIKNIKTNNKKYGVDFIFKSTEFKNKSKKTKFEKYGNENYLNLKKSKETNKKLYGFEHVAQNNEIKEKVKIFNKNKYGFEYYTQTDDYKLKTKKTNKKLYGVEYTLQRPDVKIKSKKTNIIKYGFENPMQNLKIFNNQQKLAFKLNRFKDTNLYYQGTYELDFLNKYNLELSKIKYIKYIFENKEKVYHPDFYYKPKNLIIEIKSSYYYYKFLDKNLAKQKACLEQGYNFIFIIDKKYDEFEIYISSFLYSDKNIDNDSGSPNPIILSTS